MNKCPTCQSPNPANHPAVQSEGEVHLCEDSWHKPTAAEIRERERDQGHGDKEHDLKRLHDTIGRLIQERGLPWEHPPYDEIPQDEREAFADALAEVFGCARSAGTRIGDAKLMRQKLCSAIDLLEQSTDYRHAARVVLVEALALMGTPQSASERLMDESGKFFDWGNSAGTALKAMMDAYERRIRSLCTPEQLEQRPWECMEFIEAKRILDAKPNWEVAVNATDATTDSRANK